MPRFWSGVERAFLEKTLMPFDHLNGTIPHSQAQEKNDKKALAKELAQA